MDEATYNFKKKEIQAQQQELIEKSNKAIQAAMKLMPPDVVQRCLAGNISLEMKDQVKTHVERIVFGKVVQVVEEKGKPTLKIPLDPLTLREQEEVDKNLKFLQSKMFQLVREICLMFTSYSKLTEEEIEVMSEEEKLLFLENNLQVPVQDMSETFNAEKESREPAIATMIEEDSNLPIANLVESQTYAEPIQQAESIKQAEPPAEPQIPWYRRKWFGGGNATKEIDAIMKRFTSILQDAPPLIQAIVTLMQFKPENVVFALYGAYSKIMESPLKNRSVNLRAKLAENLFFQGVKQYQKGEKNPFALAPTAIATSLHFIMPKLPKSVANRLANMREKGNAVSTTVSKNVGSFTKKVSSAFGFKPKVAGTRRRRATLRARGRTSSRRRAAARAGP